MWKVREKERERERAEQGMSSFIERIFVYYVKEKKQIFRQRFDFFLFEMKVMGKTISFKQMYLRDKKKIEYHG